MALASSRMPDGNEEEPRGRHGVKPWLLILGVGGVLGVGAGFAASLAWSSGETSRAAAQGPSGAAGSTKRGADVARPAFPGLDPTQARADGDALVAPLSSGRQAVLSLDPGLQAHLTAEYSRFEVPYGATVAVEPETGRVLAYVTHSSANAEAGDLVLDATPPSASVFKTITAAALVDAGVVGDTEVCFHGGSRRLMLEHLSDSERDRECATLADALGSSINAVFAKLAVKHLNRPTLERYASAFGYGHALPFDIRTRPSPFEVPDDEAEKLEFARTSAGFWHTHMSPLHGAVIAATFANDGRMMRPTLVDELRAADGTRVFSNVPSAIRQVIPRATARAVGQMMERTVTRGTARRSFFDRRGRPFLPGIRVAGKTGTLSASEPYRGYTWWVGYAPLDDPKIAVAALVVNEPRWRIKASYMAREALRYYLLERPSLESAPPEG